MRITIIVSAYKRYKYINEAIKSVISQTKKPDEIIIAIDNPNVLKIPKTNIKIKIIEIDNLEYGKAIAQCLDEVDKNTDIVMFLEDDDLFRKDKIEKIVKYFKKIKDIVAIHNSQYLIDKDGKKIETKYYAQEYQPKTNIVVNLKNVYTLYKMYPFLHHNVSSFSFKFDILKKYKKLFNFYTTAIDIFLFFIGINEGKILHIKDKLTYFRINGTSSLSLEELKDFKAFKEKKIKQLCLAYKHLNDWRELSKIFTNEACKKIIDEKIFRSEFYLYIFKDYLKKICRDKISLPNFFNLVRKIIKYKKMNILSKREYLEFLLLFILSKFFKKIAMEIVLRYLFSKFRLEKL
jgi:glycosyltransferase involved in cell wall biosynthesis